MAATKEAEAENCYKIYICMSSTYESAKMEEMGKSQVKKGNEKRNEELTHRGWDQTLKYLHFGRASHEYALDTSRRVPNKHYDAYYDTITIWQKRGGTNDNLFSNSVV